jgi:bifunctional DNA-binding transcriptional regulator/antitoxin component of YhaV-PrlF toxin-antitoxin module
MAEKQIITVVLEKHAKLNATGIAIPFDVEAAYGAKRVPVKIEVNGAGYRGTVVRMGGKYMLGIPQAFRKTAGISAGDTIVVSIERDEAPRTVTVPVDLAEAIKDADLTAVWENLSYTHRKEHVRAVEEAKQAETRIRRIKKAIDMIAGKG